MARTCVRFETIKSFARLGVGCGLSEVVALLADSEELREAATLRRNEVKALFEVNCSSDIRFPLLNDKALTLTLTLALTLTLTLTLT